MLVLTRRANQSIIIANDIVVTVLEVRGDQVRIGIKAPKDVTVHREEVYLEIQRENREAAMHGDVAIDLPLPVPNRPAGTRPPIRGAAPRAASGRPIPPPPPKPPTPPTQE